MQVLYFRGIHITILIFHFIFLHQNMLQVKITNLNEIHILCYHFSVWLVSYLKCYEGLYEFCLQQILYFTGMGHNESI
jgi:hypothetical protein